MEQVSFTVPRVKVSLAIISDLVILSPAIYFCNVFSFFNCIFNAHQISHIVFNYSFYAFTTNISLYAPCCTVLDTISRPSELHNILEKHKISNQAYIFLV